MFGGEVHEISYPYIKDMYEYNCKVVSVYDGDTCRCDIDLGFGVVLRKQAIRLYGINTPELRGGSKATKEAGLRSKAYLVEAVMGKEGVLLRTHRDRKGKYGRWLGELFVDERNINRELVENGLAVEYG